MQGDFCGLAVFAHHSRLQDHDRAPVVGQGRYSETKHLKAKYTAQKTSRGSVLFATLIVIGVVGVALISYLSLLQTRAQLASGSQSWNLAMPVAEAGVEEA